MPHRIAEIFAVFDFELSADANAAIDPLDTGKRGVPNPPSSLSKRSDARSRKRDRGVIEEQP